MLNCNLKTNRLKRSRKGLQIWSDKIRGDFLLFSFFLLFVIHTNSVLMMGQPTLIVQNFFILRNLLDLVKVLHKGSIW